MTWTTYKASDIGFNAQFGGYEGHFTMTPAWTLSGDQGIKINADNVIFLFLQRFRDGSSGIQRYFPFGGRPSQDDSDFPALHLHHPLR